VQKSIRDSVHKLLSDQVEALGLGAFYEVQQTIIKGANGTEFLFSGLSDQTAESIKSFEGVDDVWVEEA
jgi:phage terminase large subunit